MLRKSLIEIGNDINIFMILPQFDEFLEESL